MIAFSQTRFARRSLVDRLALPGPILPVCRPRRHLSLLDPGRGLWPGAQFIAALLQCRVSRQLCCSFQIEKRKVLQSELKLPIPVSINEGIAGIFATARNLHNAHCHAGLLVYRRHDRFFPHRPRLRSGVPKIMTPWELVMGLVMAVGLTVYLVYAMLRPEKF
jgi:K+-transporting ATPase KdpF subunit